MIVHLTVKVYVVHDSLLSNSFVTLRWPSCYYVDVETPKYRMVRNAGYVVVEGRTPSLGTVYYT